MKVILPKKIMEVRVCETEGKTRNTFRIKNNPFRTAYITYQIITKQIDSTEFFLYSICSGCAAEP